MDLIRSVRNSQPGGSPRPFIVRSSSTIWRVALHYAVHEVEFVSSLFEGPRDLIGLRFEHPCASADSVETKDFHLVNC